MPVVRPHINVKPLWPQKFNQFTLKSKCKFVPNLTKIPSCVLEILGWPLEVRGRRLLIKTNYLWLWSEFEPGVTFCLWLPKSNQFILGSEWTFMQILRKIPRNILEISRSQKWVGRADRPHLVLVQRHEKNMFCHLCFCHVTLESIWLLWLSNKQSGHETDTRT